MFRKGAEKVAIDEEPKLTDSSDRGEGACAKMEEGGSTASKSDARRGYSEIK